MRFFRAGGLVLAAALFAAPTAAAETRIRPLSDQLFASLDAQRTGSGVRAWERRPELDAAAATIADEIARSGNDFDDPIAPVLREAGAEPAFRVVPIIQTFKGTRVLDSLLGVWETYPPAREGLVDPRIDAIGMADARLGDGTRVLVSLLVEDLDVSEFDVADLERRTAAEINRIRDARGLSPLRMRAAIAQVARGHSADMAARGYFSHESPSGGDAARRVRKAGLSFRAVAENIFSVRGADDPVDAAVANWMRSYGHRRNILAPRFNVSGIGVAISGDGVFYFTQVFLETENSTDDR